METLDNYVLYIQVLRGVVRVELVEAPDDYILYIQVLRGVVRVELVETPDDYIPTVLERVKTKYIERTYRFGL